MNPSSSAPMVVACLGASMTEAKISYDWIGELQRRPINGRFTFRNFGVGGDLAYNALLRLPQVLSCRPQKLIVLVGHNDVIAYVSKRARRHYKRWKRLPQDPDPRWYEENIRAMIRHAKSESSTDIAICSLSSIGEEPLSAWPFQNELNLRIREYSEIVRRVAGEENIYYIPYYETFLQHVTASPGRALRFYSGFAVLRDFLRRFILGWDFDKIGRRNGWIFHSDGLHLNSRGGKILADLVQNYLDASLRMNR